MSGDFTQKIYCEDIYHLEEEGWEFGASQRAAMWIRHPDEHPEWVLVWLSPAGEDSLVLDEDEVENGLMYIGPAGPTNTITEALQGLLEVGL